MTPLPSTGDVTPVKLFALPTGWLCHPDRWLFEDGDTDQVNAIQQYPDYSFLIRHPSGQNVLFDLGLRKVRSIRFPCCSSNGRQMSRSR